MPQENGKPLANEVVSSTPRQWLEQITCTFDEVMVMMSALY